MRNNTISTWVFVLCIPNQIFPSLENGFGGYDNIDRPSDNSTYQLLS